MPRWVKITGSVLSFLLIGMPTVFSVWWYLFFSVPPFAWFKERGLPDQMNNPLWLLVIPVTLGTFFLFLIWINSRPNREVAKPPIPESIHASSGAIADKEKELPE